MRTEEKLLLYLPVPQSISAWNPNIHQPGNTPRRSLVNGERLHAGCEHKKQEGGGTFIPWFQIKDQRRITSSWKAPQQRETGRERERDRAGEHSAAVRSDLNQADRRLLLSGIILQEEVVRRCERTSHGRSSSLEKGGLSSITRRCSSLSTKSDGSLRVSSRWSYKVVDSTVILQTASSRTKLPMSTLVSLRFAAVAALRYGSDNYSRTGAGCCG